MDIIRKIEKMLNEMPYVEKIREYAKWDIEPVKNGAIVSLHILDVLGNIEDTFKFPTNEHAYVNIRDAAYQLVTADRCARKKIDFSKLSKHNNIF